MVLIAAANKNNLIETMQFLLEVDHNLLLLVLLHRVASLNSNTAGPLGHLGSWSCLDRRPRYETGAFEASTSKTRTYYVYTYGPSLPLPILYCLPLSKG